MFAHPDATSPTSPLGHARVVSIHSESDILSPGWLRAVADLAEGRAAVRFTPGAGVLLDHPVNRPLSRDERAHLPEIAERPVRLADLPRDRFLAARRFDPAFDAFVQRYTVPHAEAGYRLVVIPLDHALSAGELRTIADIAENLGHGTIRLTADVSIRLPNVPEALLRPLWRQLVRAGLIERPKRAIAA